MERGNNKKRKLVEKEQVVCQVDKLRIGNTVVIGKTQTNIWLFLCSYSKFSH